MSSLRLIVLLAPLEHAEHAVGDEEAADDVDRPERDRDHQQDVRKDAVNRPDQQDAAEHDDAVDRVRTAHQRRVERVRHLRDDLEADERRQHQDRQFCEQTHAATPAALRAPSCTISPSRTTQPPFITSSSKSRPRSSRAKTLRPESLEACSGMLYGPLSGAATTTPLSVTNVSPGRASSQLPPASAARSTITDPARIPATASAEISFGAGRPGTSAVVTIASDLPICTVSACRWRSCSSSVSSRA